MSLLSQPSGGYAEHLVWPTAMGGLLESRVQNRRFTSTCDTSYLLLHDPAARPSPRRGLCDGVVPRGRRRHCPSRTSPPQPELKPDQGPDPLQSVGGGPSRVSPSLDNASPRPSGLDLPATGFEVAVDRI